MPNKTKPPVSTSSDVWGNKLNQHLEQLMPDDGGGLNKFEQFSQRPTNLTAEDKGKTFLYTQTGNFHQWTGTEWKVLNESVINVKDYGAIGDGVVDDTAAIQGCLDRGELIFIPKGKYLISAQLQITKAIEMKGTSETELKAYTANNSDSLINISASNVLINNLRIYSNETTYAIKLNQAITNCHLSNISISYCKGGILAYNCWCNIFENIRVHDIFESGCNLYLTNNCVFIRCSFGNTRNTCVMLDNTEGASFESCEFYNFINPNCYAILAYRAQGVIINNPYFEDATSTANINKAALIKIGGNNDNIVKSSIQINGGIVNFPYPSITTTSSDNIINIEGTKINSIEDLKIYSPSDSNYLSLKSDLNPIYQNHYLLKEPKVLFSFNGNVLLTPDSKLTKDKVLILPQKAASIYTEIFLSSIVSGQQYTLFIKLSKKFNGVIGLKEVGTGQFSRAIDVVNDNENHIYTINFIATEDDLRLIYLEDELSIEKIVLCQGLIYKNQINFINNNLDTKQYLPSFDTNNLSGGWNIGNVIYNENPTSGGYIGWICTASGTPGTWKPFGKIEL
jgi:hypothetical protein